MKGFNTWHTPAAKEVLAFSCGRLTLGTDTDTWVIPADCNAAMDVAS
jgi:hypothetical protein